MTILKLEKMFDIWENAGKSKEEKGVVRKLEVEREKAKYQGVVRKFKVKNEEVKNVTTTEKLKVTKKVVKTRNQE